MMAGPSFGSAVAVSQGAGELELGMSDFLGFGWAGFLGRGTAAPGRCIMGGRRAAVGDARGGWATHRSGRRAAGGGRRTAVGDAPRLPYMAMWVWHGGVAPRRPYMAMWGWHGGVAPLRPYIPTTHLLQ